MFASRLLCVGFLFVCFVLVTGQVYRPGGCPDVSYVNYTWENMMGRWYRHAQYPEYHPDLYYRRCISEIQVKNLKGNYELTASYYDTKTCDYKQDIVEALTMRDSPGITEELYKLPLPKYSYKVLDTDETGYGILYGCVEAGPGQTWSLEQVITYSRSPKPMSDCLKEMLHNVLRTNGINPDFLQPARDINCQTLKEEA